MTDASVEDDVRPGKLERAWLLKGLRRAAERRLVVIGRGSHTIQYETERVQLYRVMADFLTEPE
ncbi:MAG: hypothetical protein ABJE10_16635 [bacterium]